MHYAGDIVWYILPDTNIIIVLLEVFKSVRIDVVLMYDDVAVPIWSGLLMSPANSMAQFMYRLPFPKLQSSSVLVTHGHGIEGQRQDTRMDHEPGECRGPRSPYAHGYAPGRRYSRHPQARRSRGGRGGPGPPLFIPEFFQLMFPHLRLHKHASLSVIVSDRPAHLDLVHDHVYRLRLFLYTQ